LTESKAGDSSVPTNACGHEPSRYRLVGIRKHPENKVRGHCADLDRHQSLVHLQAGALPELERCACCIQVIREHVRAAGWRSRFCITDVFLEACVKRPSLTPKLRLESYPVSAPDMTPTWRSTWSQASRRESGTGWPTAKWYTTCPCSEFRLRYRCTSSSKNAPIPVAPRPRASAAKYIR